MEYTKTELHTHLVGILSAEEFIYFLKFFGVQTIHWPLSYNKIVELDEILNNPKYLSALEVKRGTSVSYSALHSLYEVRTEMLKETVDMVSKAHGLSKNKANQEVFNSLINHSLRSLVNQGVEYTEISYSFPDRIANFKIDPDLSDKIKCRFLLSTQRSNPVSSPIKEVNTFERIASKLETVLKSGNAIGFDIMGEESKLTDEERDYDNLQSSFKRKLELIFNVLVKHEDSVFRIHSGETSCSFDNTITVLRMLDEVIDEYCIANGVAREEVKLPEFRIGHGIYFDPSSEYLDLLHKLGVIIEINVSSNVALGNVGSQFDVPYKYYVSNDVPIVISTDGHGLYDTTLSREDRIAMICLGTYKYKKVKDFDDQILDRKVM